MTGTAQADVRSEEIAECRPGEIATWGDGVDRPALATPLRLAYEHAGAPAWFASAELRSMLARAAHAWAACGVAAELLPPGASATAGAVRVQWNAAAARDTFGLANLGQRTLSLNPDSFALLRQRNPRHDARQTLQMVISHEMGHFFGLMAHSRRCVDVTSYYHDGQGHHCLARDPALVKASPEYRAVLPTACDIARCRAANGR
ncbi:hypothetical protein RQP53_23650 [Paucibacter sp. APW11]|uniref:Peptidase M10 metallopeptidase domain-containing protein n=1 Tax=Roseateles aquae TaxID=3077235 RepID=A0ABU3PJT1_9BURK|nr:hypothetical protein [Paucibacter sp. APW11]MDT9002296.1 hypothetical protein [Paucibacter sp. APW11]